MSHRHADQVPSPDLNDAIGLARQLNELLAAITILFDRIEKVTALRAGEVWALLDIANAPRSRLEDHAHRIGQPTDVAHAIATALIQHGLLHCDPDTSELSVTDAGSVILSQITAMQIRLLDRLATALGPDGAAALNHTLHRLPAALHAAIED